jgi:osmotically-inducible protein OsmY
MKRWMMALTLIVAMSVLASATEAEDNRIYDQVRLRLAGDGDIQGGSLEVIVKDGAVTIKGKVTSDRAKTKATKVTKKVKNVKSVDNQLVVTLL